MPTSITHIFSGACSLVVLLLLSTGIYAQQTVTGRIVSKSDQQPIPGATIQVKGATTGAQ